MKVFWGILIAELAIIAAGGVAWLIVSRRPLAPPDPPPPPPARAALRIGLISERDIFAQRAHYRKLADYLGGRLGRPIELVTLNSYQAILGDFAHGRVDAAFLGSFVAVLSNDRLGIRPLVRPVGRQGPARYCGVIIVPENSPIRTVDDLAGRSIAMVRMTTAGHLFPVLLTVRHKLTGPGRLPRFVWVGTHDQVAAEVAAGRVDAGAIKDLRLDDWQREHPGVRFRRLASSPFVPENALWIRADLAETVGPSVADVLLKMDSDPAGRGVLEAFGAVGFAPHQCLDYKPVFDMVDELGADWTRMGVPGPPPWCACLGTTRPDWSGPPATGPGD